MKKRNRMVAFALSVALVVTAMPGSVSAASKPVKLSQKVITLNIGKKGGKTTYGKARIKLKTAKGVKVKSIRYKVKNKKIAKVNKKGTVTARKKGKTKITVTVKYTQKKKLRTKKLSLTVKVKKGNASSAVKTTVPSTAVPSVSVAPGVPATAKPDHSIAPTPETTPDPSKVAEIHMIRKNYITYVGGNTGINPQVLPETAKNPVLDYESADSDIATVNEYGLISGVKEGVTTITISATDGSGITESVTIKVVTDRKVAEYVDDYYDAANVSIIQDALEGQEESEVSWSAVSALEKTVSEREDAIIRNAVDHTEDSSAGSAEEQIAALYQTAADGNARETNGIGGLSAYIEEIDGANTVEELLEVEAELDRKGILGIFNTSAGLSQEDNKTFQLYFDLSDYALAEYSYTDEDYDDDTYDEYDLGEDEDIFIDSEEALQTYADSLLEAAGEEESERSKNIEALKEIFKNFAVSYDFLFDIMQDLPEDLTEEEIIQLLQEMGMSMMVEYSPKELQALMKNCDLLSYLKTAGYDTSQNILVAMPSQMEQIDACLTEENLPALKEYAKYEMLNQYATYMTEEIYHNYALLYEAENGVSYTEYEDFALSKTKELLEWEISSIYTEKYESAAQKQDITAMVDEIAEQYIKEIDACGWMSETTKTNAKKKLSALGKNVLYPDDYSRYLLENDLALPEEGGSLLGNVMIIDGEDAEAEREVIGEKMTNQDWQASPLTVNAFYIPTVNGIYICSGMVGAPVYDSERSDAMNYGGLGMIIAHEISHAFDETGSLYDENGDVGDWWTEEDAGHYEEIQRQLVDYYNTYYLLTLEDMPLFQDGQTTLSENIADLAGVACVVKLMGDDKETRKDFLISFANMWAEVGTLTEDNLFTILFDSHSVAKVRVNAVVSMLDEFYETFDVQEGDAMYVAPENRIRIWG